MKIKILDSAMLIGAAATIALGSFGSFAEKCEHLSEDVFRLHILANSDSDEDQELKYKVRDFVLTEFSDTFSECSDKDEAALKAQSALAEITQSVNDFIAENGFDYTVKCETTKMYFTTRTYENITMPAGNYSALRIIIGEGQGKNWWCVMFPPLCIPTVRADLNDFVRTETEATEEQDKTDADKTKNAEDTELNPETDNNGDITPRTKPNENGEAVNENGSADNNTIEQTERDAPVLFSEEQSEVIENGGKVEIRFAIFEFIASLFGF